MEPWQSWAIITAIVAGAGYYYTRHDQKRAVKGRSQSVPDHVESSAIRARPDVKSRRGKEQDSRLLEDVTAGKPAKKTSSSLVSNSNGDAKKPKKKEKKVDLPRPNEKTEMKNDPVIDVGMADDEGEGNDDTAFAKMMSNAQVGTSLSKVPESSERKNFSKRAKGNKSVVNMPDGNASSQNDILGAYHMSPDSSTTGMDADDDLSPGYSPDLGATSVTTPSATDVSDMLPPAPKGSSILRITDPINPPVVRQAKQPKKAPEPETKKQRQNRRKKDEAKAARAEEEKERRALLEIQLRTAREAEGRPARNGLGASSAWNKKESDHSRPVARVNHTDDQTLLDTFGDSEYITQDSAAPTTNSKFQHTATSVNANQKSFLGDRKPRSDGKDVLSEEEQLRLLGTIEDANAWTTVEKGGKSFKRMPNVIADNLKESRGAIKQPGALIDERKVSTASGLSTAESRDSDLSLHENDDEVPTNGIAAPGMGTSLGMNEQSAKSSLSTPGTASPISINARSSELRGGLSKEEIHARIYTTERPKPPAHISHDVAIDSGHYPRPIASRWLYLSDREKEKRRAHIKKNLDRKIWNYDNIHVHPDFEPGVAGFDLQFALTGSPMDSDWVDASDDGSHAEDTGMYRSNGSKWAINGMSRDFDETYPNHPHYTAPQKHPK